MCGIFNYQGNKNATNMVVKGLKRLEYRGYDSWGILLVTEKNQYQLFKEVGEINEKDALKDLPESNFAIGHTRWATHGGVNKTNAHPHISEKHKIALVHNGIVENFSELKKELQIAGKKFISETDTEVILKLIELELENNSMLLNAISNVSKTIEGRNTFVVLDSANNQIIASKNGSPLVIGLTENLDEIYFSSDTYSFSPWVNKIIVLDNNEIAQYNNAELNIFSNDLIKLHKESENIDFENVTTTKEGHDHFMLKEILETPYVISQVVNQDQEKMNQLAQEIKKAKKVFVMGSGSSGMTSNQIAYFLRKYGKVHAQGLIGAEATEYIDLFDKYTLIICPSQSGETADVLEILEIAKQKGVKIASYVNMLGSSMSRLSDFAFLSNAGPEICVMTTKVFSSQITWGYLLAKTVQGKYTKGLSNLKKLIEAQTKYLDDKPQLDNINELAKYLTSKEHIYILAKGQNLYIAGEGMVKIVEGAYIHAHAMPAGDLKHYAITLMEEGVDVIALISNDENKKDVISAIAEIRTRKAHVAAISNGVSLKADKVLSLPDLDEVSSLFNIVIMQLLSYYMAVELGTNVDKPRNIAKSVTVK